jgi:hypothetical protein
MDYDTTIPPPKSLADTLREIPVGTSVRFADEEHSALTIRSTLTRIKKADAGAQYTTRPDGDGIRVWRLA